MLLPSAPFFPMIARPTAQALSTFLREAQPTGTALDRLKIGYRPYICPFDDLLACIDEGDRVFDVGCGSGQFCLLAATFARPSEVAGVEISARLIENARVLFRSKGVVVPADFQVYDGLTFPDSVGRADKVFLIDVLHHVPPAKHQEFLIRLQRAMRPGATLVLKDIEAGSPLVYCNKLHDLIFAREIGSERTGADLAALLAAAGFQIGAPRSRRMFWYPHVTILARKP